MKEAMMLFFGQEPQQKYLGYYGLSLFIDFAWVFVWADGWAPLKQFIF